LTCPSGCWDALRANRRTVGPGRKVLAGVSFHRLDR